MWKAFRVVARRRVADRKDPTWDEVYAAGGAESPPVGCEFGTLLRKIWNGSHARGGGSGHGTIAPSQGAC